MTEAEWRKRTNPWPMLQFLFGKIGRRQLVLFVSACCRRFEKFPDPRDHLLLDRADDFADGTLTAEQFQKVLATAAFPTSTMLSKAFTFNERMIAERECSLRGTEATATAELLRAVVHWPSAPAVAEIKPTWQRRLSEGLQEVRNQLTRATEGGNGTVGSFADIKRQERARQAEMLRHVIGNPFQNPAAVAPECLAWSGGAVVVLAQTIYQERKWEQMPILADALEEAGCTDTNLLRHCRQPGEHMRGCWALDLLRK